MSAVWTQERLGHLLAPIDTVEAFVRLLPAEFPAVVPHGEILGTDAPRTRSGIHRSDDDGLAGFAQDAYAISEVGDLDVPSLVEGLIAPVLNRVSLLAQIDGPAQLVDLPDRAESRVGVAFLELDHHEEEPIATLIVAPAQEVARATRADFMPGTLPGDRPLIEGCDHPIGELLA